MQTIQVLALAVAVGACGGAKSTPEPKPEPTVPSDNNSCGIEMSVAPDAPTAAGPITFQIVEHDGATYQWTVTGGTIKAGQGTATITVEGAPAGKLSATVALSGFPATCPPTATASVDVK